MRMVGKGLLPYGGTNVTEGSGITHDQPFPYPARGIFQGKCSNCDRFPVE